MSNCGSYLVEYTNPEFLLRGGCKVDVIYLGNSTYAHTLRTPHIQNKTAQFDDTGIAKQTLWDSSGWGGLIDEALGGVCELAAMYLFTKRDYATLVEHTYFFTMSAFFAVGDREGMLRNAALALPGEADAKIRNLFEGDEIAYIHAHNAAHGCFAAKVERV